MKHTCHAYGCTTEVRPTLLMCLTHWRMVPQGLKVLVWKHYRPGQCDDKDPSAAWHAAADRAIAAVAAAEGHSLVAAHFLKSAARWDERAQRELAGVS